MLVLPIKKKWLDMIKAGAKKEEYRVIKPYYNSRFKKIWGQDRNKVVEIKLRNGYSYKSPSVVISCTLDIGYGKVEWGAAPGKKYYILKILKVV